MSADDSTRSQPTATAIDQHPHVLVIVGGSSRRVALPVSGRVVVGRATEADLCIDDESISRRHAMFTVTRGEVSVADLDSHNGTRVNGERLDRMRRLLAGDVIQLGDAVLVIHGGAERARDVLDTELLRHRLDDEIERAAAYDRELGVIALAGAVGAAATVEALAGELRPIDLVAERGSLVVVLAPELDRDATRELAVRCLARLGGSVGAGFACCPDDGADADALLTLARVASSIAEPGQVVEAAAATSRLEIGDRMMIVADPAMVRLVELTRQLACTELTVLVRGDTGVGKEHIAHALHHLGPRASQAFVTLNCAAVQDTLIESELFGYERGAFTGATATKLGLLEAARGGTIFLDEIGELSHAMQAKLLRALDAKRITRVGSVVERDIDIRIVAATHRDLEQEAAAGRFRRDLYFRIGGATIVLPALRERRCEIAWLARSFLDDARLREGRDELRLSAGAMRGLARYGWPGNVRELRNAIAYGAAIATETATIEIWHLPPHVSGLAESVVLPPVGGAFRPIAEEVRELERRRMREAIAAADGVLKEAARLIGMPLRTFHLKAKHYGLTAKRA